MARNIWEEGAVMDALEDDVHRQILAIKEVEKTVGEFPTDDFATMLRDKSRYHVFFRVHIWFALPPDDRVKFFEKYARADDIERPFIASAILCRLDELATAAYGFLCSDQGRSKFLH